MKNYFLISLSLMMYSFGIYSSESQESIQAERQRLLQRYDAFLMEEMSTLSVRSKCLSVPNVLSVDVRKKTSSPRLEYMPHFTEEIPVAIVRTRWNEYVLRSNSENSGLGLDGTSLDRKQD